ncbi:MULTISPECIES: hypothetical protein [unclassified Microcoleus]|uniref:hypothetical protein n=1 Tax=unclassified Microcoleus TaxID=2642155 RepID=UPI002FD1502A
MSAGGGIIAVGEALEEARTGRSLTPIAQSENCAKLLLCLEFEAPSICPVQGRSEIFQNIFALPLDLC